MTVCGQQTGNCNNIRAIHVQIGQQAGNIWAIMKMCSTDNNSYDMNDNSDRQSFGIHKYSKNTFHNISEYWK